jgi:hypothetical protein
VTRLLNRSSLGDLVGDAIILVPSKERVVGIRYDPCIGLGQEVYGPMTIQTPPDSDIPERDPNQEQPQEPGIEAPGGDPQTDAPMRMPSDNPDVETEL